MSIYKTMVFAVAVFGWSCAQETQMSGENKRSLASAAPADEADAEAIDAKPTPGPNDPGKLINHSVSKESERLVETFSFPGIETHTEKLSNPREPLAVQSFTWNPSAVVQKALSVAASGPGSDSFTKTAPDRRVDSSAGNEVAIIAIIDSSESFAAVSEMKERTKLAFDEAVSQLFADNINFQFVVCGLEGTTGSIEARSVSRGSLSEAAVKTAVRGLADEVFSKTGSGSEKLFRSAKLCTDKLPAASKIAARAARGYLFITDAPNCKNNDNMDASECDRSSNSKPDHHLHMWNNASGLGAAKNLSALSIIYRKTNGVCGNADALEVPNAGESYTDNSQYADAVKNSLEVLYPAGAGAPMGYSSLVGDVCASSYSPAPARQLAKVVKDIRDHRLLLTRAYNSFPLHPVYNLDVAVNGVDNDFIVRDGVIIANGAGTVVATHHTTNSYDKLSFTLSSTPEPNSVVGLYWDNATAPNLSCPNRADFGNPVAYDCRWQNKVVYIRNIEVLPATDPVSVKTKAFTAKYTKAVEKTKSFSIGATDAMISSSIVMSVYPAAAAAQVGGMSVVLSNAGKTAALNFDGNDLPPGDYVVSYRTNSPQTYTHSLTLASGDGNFVCFDPSASARIEDGVIIVDPSSAVKACSLNAAKTAVIFTGEGLSAVPFKVAFKTLVAPATVMLLGKAPDTDSLVVKTLDMNGAPRTNSSFVLEGLQVKFAQALAPGESAEVIYKRTPPQPGPDFPLLAVAYDDLYEVSLVRDLVSENLSRGVDFEVVAPQGGVASIKLLKSVAPGAMMAVRYTLKDLKSETTAESEIPEE